MSTDTQQNHAAPLARSNSFFGTIKNIVTAPFTWFAGSEDEFEDEKGKRRRLPIAQDDARMGDSSLPSRAKRARLGSPVRDTQPYLDPPRSTFTQSLRISDHRMSGPMRDSTRSRKMLHISSTSNQSPRNRRTLSPLPSGSHLKPDGVTRTMSLDPPSRPSFSSRVQPAPPIPDLQPEPNRVGHSTSNSRDMSMSPRRLRVRSSLTPQPSGTAFGPVVPPRRERGLDEPPPLAALMSNPIFVKPPPGVQKQGAAECQKPLTLGTLMDSQRNTRTLARQSSILFGTGSMTDVSAPGHLWPVNKAEIALHELEVYKTPLLPTRLKGATAVPDMFLQKERRHITLMTDDRPVKPRLGTKSKRKEMGMGTKGERERERETINGTKPYAGEGGMKRWLARRKKEEEEAKEKERAEAMEDERADEKKRKEEEEEKKKREEELKVPLPPPPAHAFEARVSREGPLSSSLRVGRTRTGRNHIEHPVSRRAKFSAAFEDEDEDMEESRLTEQKALEEAAKKAPVFELPTGFTFAKETTITHDLTRAKEPPITSLPFSLTQRAVVPAPAPAPPPAEAAKAAPIPAAPAPALSLPTISLVPSTPEPIKVAPEAPTLPVTVPPAPSTAPTSSGVPNFFANSSVFARPGAIAIPPSLLTPSVLEEPKPAEVPEPGVPKTAGASSSLFGASSRPISAFPAPTSDSTTPSSSLGAPPTVPKETEKPTPSPSSPFTFGAPAKPVESIPAPASSQPPEQSPAAEPAKPTALSNGTPFTFSTPPPAPATAAATVSASPAPTVEAPKSVFTFGQPTPAAPSTPASAPVTVPPSADTSKPLFGASSSATPFSFGQCPSTGPAEEKPATNPFSFGTPSTVEKKPATGFTFGTSTASTATPAAPAPFSFGGTPSGTSTADVSIKPFSFGTTVTTRPVTPPKAVQEVTMDESPARDMVLNGNGKAPERPTLSFAFNAPSGSALFAQSPATTSAPFSFGTSGTTVNPFSKEEKKETKPAVSFGGFGQAPSVGFSFGPKPPESPTTTAPASTSFQFSQPSPNVAPTSPFTFGAPPASASPFGQPTVASAPSSPSFNRPASFAFGPPTTTQPATSPFTFGASSQPASPATGNTTLPSGTAGSTPFTFGAGANVAVTPAISFGLPTTASNPAAGGSLFTMGSAPPPTEGRRIKGLPRRGVTRR